MAIEFTKEKFWNTLLVAYKTSDIRAVERKTWSLNCIYLKKLSGYNDTKLRTWSIFVYFSQDATNTQH